MVLYGESLNERKNSSEYFPSAGFSANVASGSDDCAAEARASTTAATASPVDGGAFFVSSFGGGGGGAPCGGIGEPVGFGGSVALDPDDGVGAEGGCADFCGEVAAGEVATEIVAFRAVSAANFTTSAADAGGC